MNRLPSIRRWGVAALTGVTLFGGLSIVGAGGASAASAPTVTAALAPTATATTIAGTATAQLGAAFVLTVSGTPTVSPAPDYITLTLACPTVGTAVFSGATVTATSGTFATTPTATVSSNSSGCSTLTILASGATTLNPSITVTPSFTTAGTTTQALSISGTYSSSGLISTSFTVPTVANTVWYSVSSNVPAVSLTEPGTTAISSITINDPANLPAADQLTATGSSFSVQLPAGDTWSALPTVTPFGLTIGTPVLTTTSLLTIPVTSAPVGGAQVTISGASIVTGAGFAYGSQNATVKVVTSTLASTLVASASVGNILGTVNTISGASGTADGTVAAEFENAFPANAVAQTGGNATVVLATDTPHANGSDALAASYLEGMLGTGLLITPATTLGADAQAAIQHEGVSTVYVLGGSLAISPAVIAQIQALPAYKPGGLVLTGSNVKVVGPIAGADGTAAGTASMIATYFGPAYGAASLSGAYNNTGGVYNDTTGSASTPPSVGYLPTAIVVASTDWQDAMAIAPEAYAMHFPVILAGPSSSTTLGADAQAALTALNVKQVIVIGGQLALQNTVEAQIAALNGGISVLRIAGMDATDTAAQIASFAWGTGTAGLNWTAANGHNSILVSHADYWSDALGAAALGGGANSATFGKEPILLVESPNVVGTYTTAELKVAGTAGVTNLNVLGGPLAMPASTVQTLLAGL